MTSAGLCTTQPKASTGKIQNPPVLKSSVITWLLRVA